MKKDDKMHVAIYMRVGNGSQLSEVSMENQRKALRLYAQQKGLDIVGEFQDIGSGRSVERPGLKQMISVLRQPDVQGALTMDLGRMARDFQTLDMIAKQIGDTEKMIWLEKEDRATKIMDVLSPYFHYCNSQGPQNL